MIEFKRFEREHIAEVAEIESLCFSAPWSESALELLLGEKGFGVVALVDGRVAAYGGMITVLDEGQITNIATHPDFRRQGLARGIMRELDRYSSVAGICFLSLEVREKNVAARALYSSCGWREVGIRKNFYSRPVDNAVVMTKDFLKGN